MPNETESAPGAERGGAEQGARVAQLIDRLALEEMRWRMEAEEALVALGDGALPQVLAAMGHALPSVRFHLVRVASRVATPATQAAVEAALVERLGDAENRSAVAIEAEKQLVKLEARDALLAAAADRARSVGVRARATRALGALGHVAFADADALSHEEEPAVRAQATTLLATLDTDESRARLKALLEDGEGMVRNAAAEALVGLRSASARPVLEAALRDPEDRWWAEELLDALSEYERTGELLP